MYTENDAVHDAFHGSVVHIFRRINVAFLTAERWIRNRHDAKDQ